MKIGEQHVEAIRAHAREAAPWECVGFLALHHGEVIEVYRAQNTAAEASWRFEMDPASLIIANVLEDEGYTIVVYHSHPMGEPLPSMTDVAAAWNWPYLIIGQDGEVRCWIIEDGEAIEEPVEIQDRLLRGRPHSG